MKKAVFLDKDGTLIYDLPYNADPALVSWKEDSFRALKLLADHDYLLVIVTNQSGVARGKFTEQDLIALGAAMKYTLHEQGIPLAGFYYCPHFSGGSLKEYAFDCDCRKPKPGLLINAARDLQIDLAASWMIGDMLKDVEAGIAAGCKAVLARESEHVELITDSRNHPDFVAGSLMAAAEHIVNL